MNESRAGTRELKSKLSEYLRRVKEAAWKYDVQGYDSLHLAGGIALQETLGVQITLATYDREIAAQKAGMESVPPELLS